MGVGVGGNEDSYTSERQKAENACKVDLYLRKTGRKLNRLGQVVKDSHTE